MNILLVLPESHPSNAMHAVQFQKHSKIKAKSLSSPPINHISHPSALLTLLDPLPTLPLHNNQQRIQHPHNPSNNTIPNNAPLTIAR
jgi:hypothetical protein